MGEGFIVRRGGGGQQTVKPIFNSLTSVGFTSLTLSVTNDSNSIATLYYSVVNTEPAPAQAGTFETEFAGKETKNITITGLTSGTTYTVYIKAIAIGEFPSETVIVPNLTTGVAMNATGGTITEYNVTNSPTKRYRSHTFTGNGTFQVTQLSNMGATFNQVDYLIVAGGGGGCNGYAGGGGAGGMLVNTVPVTQTSYSVTVGNGGAGINNTSTVSVGNSGANSSIFGVIATGGGGGRGCKIQTGGNGGSGGGGTCGFVVGGTGISGQGFGGGTGGSESCGGSTRCYWGGGGGGAGGAGSTGADAGFGGPGLNNNYRTGSNIIYATGGGGGQYNIVSKVFNTGGSSNIHNNQGGHGSEQGGSATANTGSGAGSAGGVGNGLQGTNGGGNGASGIVVVRYEIAPTT
jgi:hypothetical protein